MNSNLSMPLDAAWTSRAHSCPWPGSRWLAGLVYGIAAGLALLALSSLPSFAETPSAPNNRKTVSSAAVLDGFQQHFALLTRVSEPALPPAVLLPQRAPLLLPPTGGTAASGRSEAWRGGLNPLALVAALLQQQAARQQLHPAGLPSSVALSVLPPPLPAVVAGRSGFSTSRPPAATAAGAARSPYARAGVRPVQPVGAAVDLDLVTHHSLVVQSPVPLKRVSITDESIAQALVVSPNQVLVQGRAPGEVSLLLWDADANARAYTVRVQLDPQPLQSALRHLFPHQPLAVSASGDALVVAGTLPSAAVAKRVLEVAGGFSHHVINDLNVDAAADPAQVLLQVRFAEIDRSAVTQFGANLISTGAGNTVGSIGTGQFGGPAGVVAPGNQNVVPPGGSVVGNPGNAKGAKFGLSDLLNIFLFRSDTNLALTLQALQQHNLLQILAEPNLVAMDGKEASFLAGGEFPFPVVQGQGSVNNVTIQFKPFGVNLHFKPTILPDGTIDLQVAPEVSALDFSNALTVSGFLIPALSTRRASTELELSDGESFVIAGLMDNRLTDNLSKLPGLGDLPILGRFFQSRNSNKSRTELMVVVTAHLVHPSRTAPASLRMPKPFLPPTPGASPASGPATGKEPRS